MYTITITQPDGSEETIEQSDKPNLGQLQEWVGGYIELIPHVPGGDLWINEEGKLKGLLENFKATGLYLEYLHPGDMIVGPAVLVSKTKE